MTKNNFSIRYPRRTALRKGLSLTARLLLGLLTDVEISGRDLLPHKGPIILAGNHAEALEAVMMIAYTPGIVEFIGNGDIPFDPNYAFIAHAYGLIPVNRGNLDREGLRMGLDVLLQDGILGIFPEGGIWDPSQMQAQSGIAWLSYKAKAPILPIGFGGIQGALKKALSFRHPHLSITVGNLIEPVTIKDNELSKKENLANASQKIMKKIQTLVPPEERDQIHLRVDEHYHLKVEAIDRGIKKGIPAEYKVRHGSVYAQLLFNPVMMDVLVRNLRLPIKPLKRITAESKLEPILTAWQAILNYLEINPGFFTYRFGVQKGLTVKKALTELLQLGNWALDSGYRLSVVPFRKYRNAKTGAEIFESGGCFPKSM